MAPKSIRFSPIVLALLASGSLLLSACGADDGAPRVSATPSTSNPGNNGATPASNNTSSSLLFAGINVVDASGNPAGQQIVLVDPATGAPLQAIGVDEQSTHLAAQAFTVSADGLSTQAGDDKKLYYTNGGKLFELGLTKPATPGNGRQVSSEAHICALTEVFPKDATANTSVLVLQTAGADGLCQFTDDNEVKLVSSDMVSSVPAVTLNQPKQVSQILQAQRDGQGNLVRLIGYQADVAASAAPSNDPAQSASLTKFSKVSLIALASDLTPSVLTTLPADVDIDGDGTPDLPSVTSFGKVAGSSTQAYLQVGKDIRLLSWESGTPTLGTTPVATLASGVASFVRTDAQGTYFVDGLAIKRLPAYGAGTGTQPKTLADTDEVQPGGAMTASSLLVVVRTGDTFALKAIRKSDGTIATVSFPNGNALKVEAVNGDTAVVSQAAASEEGGALWRVDATVVSDTVPITPTLISGTGRARVITTVHGDITTLPGDTQNTHVLWCDATKSCNPQNVNSYQVGSGTNLLLSPAGVSGTPFWANTGANSRSTTLGLLSSSALPYDILKDGAMVPAPLVSDSVWLFDAGKAGSLSKITVPAATAQ